MIKILVSACLVGRRVRYDGKIVRPVNSVLGKWHQMRILIPFCPEMAGGLTVPRPPAEIAKGDGLSVLNGDAKIVDVYGRDVTSYFLAGAQSALEKAMRLEIGLAILKDGSPSCGSSYIYDGTFSKKQKPGKGVTSALLEKNNIRVFSEKDIKEVAVSVSGSISESILW
ncbi:MAG: DUF523 domain-containing protein [Deltaproteobacteria bacterium]|nr:DUF523 domain-containing protein [Deltaproteobacteria bacterium]MBW2218195.1 DUF523 domain-containing protein [Deltaproteobacteria bacterium]